MALIVQKYGGTSVANLDKIRNVADRVIRAKEGGNSLVVVLSAMAGETDRLIGLANQASESKPDEREYDALIATGEQVTVTLLAAISRPTGPRAKWESSLRWGSSRAARWIGSNRASRFTAPAFWPLRGSSRAATRC